MNRDLVPREDGSPPSRSFTGAAPLPAVQGSPERTQVHTIGRYTVHGRIASGGMASVHFGRLVGPAGFARTVAIKRLHPELADDPEFLAMLKDEARLAARIRHPNVVPTLDVVTSDRELLLVMEYVDGEPLSRVAAAASARSERMPVPVAAAILAGVLHGLHAAHEARTERGEALGIVHRDVSPQNILIGKDGVPRLVDFGIAKAVDRLQTTREGQIKGKLGYMAPELFNGASPSRQSDVYAAGVVLWESLAGGRLFAGGHEASVLAQVLDPRVEPPSRFAEGISPALDDLVLRSLDRNPARRFATARDMASALESIVPLASPAATGAWVEHVAAESFARRAAQLAELESTTSTAARDVPTDAFDDVMDPGDSPPPTSGDAVTTRSDAPAARDSTRWIGQIRRPAAVGIAAVMAFFALLALGAERWRGSTSPSTPSEAVSAAPPSAPSLGQQPPTTPPVSSSAPLPTPPRAEPSLPSLARSSEQPTSAPLRAAATRGKRPAPTAPTPPAARAPGVRFDDPG